MGEYGKVMMSGFAERIYQADRCEITLELVLRRSTSTEASCEMLRQREALLAELAGIGVDLSSIRMEEDKTKECSDYKTDSKYFESKSTLRFDVEPDVSSANTVHSVVSNGFDNVEFSAGYGLWDYGRVQRELVAEAIADSRATVELLAQSLGTKVVGIASANLSENEEMYDPIVGKEIEPIVYKMSKSTGSNTSLADKLSPRHIRRNASVNIVWLLDSDGMFVSGDH